MEKELEEVLPILAVEHDCILSKQGDITVVYKAELPEIFSLSDEEYETFHQTWVKALKVLPSHTVVCKQDWFLESKYSPDFSKENLSFLAESSERFFDGRPFLDHTCYVMLTKKPDGGKSARRPFSGLTGIVPEQALKPHLLQDFLESADQFRRIIEDSGFVRLVRLTDKELSSHKKGAGLIERYCFLTGKPENPLIKDIAFREGAAIGDSHCVMYSLGDAADLPSLCSSRAEYARYSTDRTKFSVGFASYLGQLLPCNHVYSQYVFLDDAHQTLKKLESKRLRLQSLSAYSRENSIARDAVSEYLNEAISEQRLPVKAHFNVLAWTEGHKSGLKEIKNIVASAFARMDATAKQETVGAPQLFWAGIPGNQASLPAYDTFDTFAEQATCFFNLESGYRSSLSPVGIRLGDRLTGKPIHVDISDEPMKMGICTNRNKFILGPSGSGKSFFTNHMVRSYYEQGAHIVLVDVGHSYKGLCDMVGGYYFTYSEANPIRFNPFFIAEGDHLDTEKRESIKTLLLALWKTDNETFSRAEYVALSNAITGYYAFLESHKDVFPCFDSFYQYLQQEYTLSLETDHVRTKDFDVENFLYVLKPYYKGGEFDYLLNARENLDLLHTPFIVFELDNIKDHPILFPVVTIIIMEVFVSKMRKLKGIRKMILVEEAWKALMKKAFAQYTQFVVKTARKFFGETVFVTQEVEDIISSPIVKNAIINNSDCKILLDQSKYQNTFEQIQELLGLTLKDKALALSINKANDPTKKYKEVYFSSLSKVYRIEVSPEEYFTYTTEEKEKMKVAEYAARYGDMEKGIRMLVEEM